jgi:demethylspheroidene O-methyltransferase
VRRELRLFQHWRTLRDRLLSSRKFQRWAAGFIFTRPIARARARALFDICAGFVYAQVLHACVELRLFDVLFERPRTRAELAARFGLPEDALQRLLAAAISLRLVERRGAAHFGLGRLGAAMVGNPGIAAMVEHHALLYADLRDPLALLRGEQGETAVGRFWSYARHASDEDVAAYSRLMTISQTMLADDIVDAYPLAKHRCLLDVGGGEGNFVAAVAARLPSLKLMLFDLPAVAQRAGERLAGLGLADRVRCAGGDFFRDPLPSGADIVSLVRVLHDHDDPSAMALLKAIHAALPPGGTVLIAEPMSDDRHPDPMADAYFGFYLLAMGRGRARRPSEIIDFLHKAGFRSEGLRRTRQPLLTQVIAATRQG